jgi:DNA-binding response OmpR family regulator
MQESKQKVLVVEDNKEHLLAMAVKLKALGYEVVGAGDGATAMMVAKRERPDAVLLDLGLPAGDGFVVLKRLRALLPTMNIPVIIVTARPPAVNRALAIDQGAVAFLQKPVKTEELMGALRKGLRSPRECQA